MIAHLLCPGPSLARYKPDPKPDLLLGVNRAAIAHACDVWVACDSALIERVCEQVQGRPHLVCGTNSRITVRDRKLWPEPITAQNDMFGFCPHSLGWCIYSSLTGLIYAAYRGATRIEVYGADMLGAEDYDGTLAGMDRSETRWRSERELWGRVVEWLAGRGVQVIRHEP